MVIRSASTADAVQIAAVMRDSWFAAYAGIIAPAVIDQATAPDGGARVRQSFRTRPWQRMLAAIDRDGAPGSPEGKDAGIVGYASFGPERDVLNTPWPYPRTKAGRDGAVAELYALYVHPAWWSTGTGRALMEQVLFKVRVAGYRHITLWVLEANARARRFYQRAGFAPDGARHALEDLGDVTEIRYRRAVRLARPVTDGNRAAAAAATYFEAWLAWYDMATTVADPVPAANWMHADWRPASDPGLARAGRPKRSG